MNSKKPLATPVKAQLKVVAKEPKEIKPFKAEDYVSANTPLD
jgi:hypothetical protein